MKARKFVALLLILVLSLTVMVTPMFAAAITTNVNKANMVDGTFRYSLDPALAVQAYGIRVTLTAADPSSGFGGAIMLNSDNNNWNPMSWSNETVAPTGNTNEYTITRLENTPAFGTGTLTFANVDIQSYWGSEISITKVEVLGSAGDVLMVSESDSENNPSEPGEPNPVITSTVIGAQLDSSGSFLIGINTSLAPKIYVIRATINVENPNSGFEGTILCNSDLNSYNLKTWGVSGKDINTVTTGNAKEYTITWSSATPIYGTAPMAWSNMMITASTGSNITINKLEFMGASGDKLFISGSTLDGSSTPSAATIAAPFENASSAVSNMKVGWNLGNALDSAGSWLSGDDPFTYETGWGNMATTKALIKQIKSAGFNAVRIPVTWRQHMDNEGNINEAWMDRVKTVVNYVLDEDMYAIINVHHDTGAGSDAWVRASTATYNANSVNYASTWTQIANAFSNFGGKLLFEGYNEMLDDSGSWSNPLTSDGYTALNQWAQLFVNTVRATGGKNATRNIIVNTYGGDSGESTVSTFVVPTDTTSNHLIVQVHCYSPDNFTSSGDWVVNPTSTWGSAGEADLDVRFARLNTYFVSQGIPVIIGEFGAHNKNNDADRAAYAKYFVSKAKQYNITGFWWDDGSLASMGIINRGNYEWIQPLIRDALIEGSNAVNLGGSTVTPAPASTPEKKLIFNEKVNLDSVRSIYIREQSATASPFIDVSSSSWSASVIERASRMGIISGFLDDTFRPNEHITRAEFAAMVVKAFGFSSTSEAQFSDTQEHWAAKEIAVLKEQGIIQGNSDNTFRPNQQLTRAEMVAALARLTTFVPMNTSQFSDIDTSEAADAINAFAANEIVSGKVKDKFYPNDFASRAEAVAVIVRLLDKVLK